MVKFKKLGPPDFDHSISEVYSSGSLEKLRMSTALEDNCILILSTHYPFIFARHKDQRGHEKQDCGQETTLSVGEAVETRHLLGFTLRWLILLSK